MGQEGERAGVEVEFLFLDECEHCDGRDELAQARDPRKRIGRDWCLRVAVGETVAARKHKPAAVGDGKLRAGVAMFSSSVTIAVSTASRPGRAGPVMDGAAGAIGAAQNTLAYRTRRKNER